jgi:hypothetical protein
MLNAPARLVIGVFNRSLLGRVQQFTDEVRAGIFAFFKHGFIAQRNAGAHQKMY